MSLVAHAETELRRAGLFDGDADYGGALAPAVLDVVRVFAAQGHSGGSAAVSLHVLGKLLRFEPLTPLTNDPAEWMNVSDYGGPGHPAMWQSRRKPSAFSTDGGRTYYDLDEPQAWWRRHLARLRPSLRFAIHRTADHTPASEV